VRSSAGGKGFNDATKYVCSRSRPSLDWTPVLLMEGDTAEGVAALKAEDDGPELQVHGSGNLAQTLIHHGLVDEYHLWVFPLVLGYGKRLFADGTIPASLRLIDSKYLHHRGLHGHLRARRRGRHGFLLEDPPANRAGRAQVTTGADAIREAVPRRW
jgi:dihydrofolate reductase